MFQAIQSPLASRHPTEKLLFSAGFLFVTLLVPPLPWAALILGLTSSIALLGRIPLKRWVRFLAAPAAFLLASSLAFLFTIEAGWTIRWTPGGWRMGMQLAVRSLAAVSALGLLSLSTPMGDTLATLRRIGVPATLTELAALIYRFLFVSMQTLDQMRIAQSWRMGRGGRKEQLRAAAMLASSLFVRCLSRARRLETGLEARGYNGTVHILEIHEPASPLVLGGIAALQVLVLIAAKVLGGAGV